MEERHLERGEGTGQIGQSNILNCEANKKKWFKVETVTLRLKLVSFKEVFTLAFIKATFCMK